MVAAIPQHGGRRQDVEIVVRLVLRQHRGAVQQLLRARRVLRETPAAVVMGHRRQRLRRSHGIPMAHAFQDALEGAVVVRQAVDDADVREAAERPVHVAEIAVRRKCRRALCVQRARLDLILQRIADELRVKPSAMPRFPAAARAAGTIRTSRGIPPPPRRRPAPDNLPNRGCRSSGSRCAAARTAPRTAVRRPCRRCPHSCRPSADAGTAHTPSARPGARAAGPARAAANNPWPGPSRARRAAPGPRAGHQASVQASGVARPARPDGPARRPSCPARRCPRA